jgi:hypothetical protein
MLRRIDIIVAGSLAMLSSALVLASTRQPCPDDCGCRIVTESTQPCTSASTLCKGNVPKQGNDGKWFCDPATYVEADWPQDCKDSPKDEDGLQWETNCNKHSRRCSRAIECNLVGNGCVNAQNGGYGNWSFALKPEECDCDEEDNCEDEE